MPAKILHFRTGPFPVVVSVDLATAEAMVESFRAKYPELAQKLEAFPPPQRLADLPLAIPTQPPLSHEDKHLRVSAKTGATWPKPKGGY